MSAEKPGFEPEETNISNAETNELNSVEKSESLYPFAVGDMVQYRATPDGPLSKPFEVAGIDDKNKWVKNRHKRDDIQRVVRVHLKGHNVSPLIENVVPVSEHVIHPAPTEISDADQPENQDTSTNFEQSVEKSEPLSDANTGEKKIPVTEFGGFHVGQVIHPVIRGYPVEGVIIDNFFDITGSVFVQLKKQDGELFAPITFKQMTDGLLPEAQSKIDQENESYYQRLSSDSNEARETVSDPEPSIGEFVRYAPKQDQEDSAEIPDPAEHRDAEQPTRFANLREHIARITANTIDTAETVADRISQTEFFSKLEAKTSESLKVWYQNYFFKKHDEASAKIDDKLKLVISEKEQMLKKQQDHEQMLKNMESLGTAALAAAPEARKEREAFQATIDKLTKREAKLSDRLEKRHEKRDGYEAERNVVADRVIQRFDTLRTPHQDKIDALESDRSDLALAIAEFDSKVKESESNAAALREKIKKAEFKSEKKVLGMVVKEIDAQLRASRNELLERRKNLNDVERSLKKAKAPLDKLKSIQDDFKAAKNLKRHEDRDSSTPQPIAAPATRNTRMNSTGDPYEIPDPVSAAQETAKPKVERILEQRSVEDLTKLWNRSFRSKQEIDTNAFNDFLKRSNVKKSEVKTIQQFAQLAQGYLNTRRSTDATIRPAKKLKKDFDAFIAINEFKYTT